jgi:Na+/H+ antiporter NhaC
LTRRTARSLGLGALAVVLFAVLGLAPGLAATSQHEEDAPAGVEATPLAGLRIEAPLVAVAGVPFTVTVTPLGVEPGHVAHLEVMVLRGEELVGSVVSATADKGGPVPVKELISPESGTAVVEVRSGAIQKRVRVRVLNGFLTLLPPILAILLAVLLRQVVVALLAGVWLGAFLISGFRPLTALARVVDRYILNALTDTSHASILIFSLLLGGMVAIVSRSGGTRGIVEALRGWAANRRSTQVVTWLMGMFIFFDDYANTLVVGNTMRPVTDRMRISREKLAYLVDSTAAPIASVALISTWIGYEVSLIGDAMRTVGSDVDPYQLFLASIPFRFYPLLALVFALAVAVSGRDLGPMLAAERRAAAGKLLRDGARPTADVESESMAPRTDAPCRWYNAVIPIFTVIGVTLGGLWITGRAGLAASGDPLGALSVVETLTRGSLIRDLGSIFSAADSYKTLLWGSALGCLVAAVLALGQRILTLAETMEAWLAGLKAMLVACVILLLAWSIGAVCEDLQTAGYVVSLISEAVPWVLLPAMVFLIAGGVAFATGTSWGTMAILMPLTVPLATEVARLNGLDPAGAHTLLLGSIASVLAGADFGDHCSPISDTTILSSMASASDHIDHVRTQMPYAVLVGAVGLLIGNLPSAWGLSPWISLLLGSAILVAVLWYFGRTTDDTPEESDRSASSRA